MQCKRTLPILRAAPAMIWMLIASAAAHAEQLPVFQLAPAEVAPSRGATILTRAYGNRLPANIESRDTPKRLIQSVGSKQVETEKASGGMFMRDTRQLWNTTLTPKLPDRDTAKRLADAFLAATQGLPANDAYVNAQFSGFAETAIAPDSGDPKQKTSLDVQVNYAVKLAIARASGRELLPVVGGGGDFKVTLGNSGDVIGYMGVWRPIKGVAALADIVSQADAEARYRRTLGDMKVTKLSSSLAYYSAPSFERQELMAPVWVMRAEAEIAGKRVPLRIAMIPATQYGPAWRSPPLVPRDGAPKPLDWTIDADEKLGSNRSLLDFFISPAQAATNWEAGTSWIGPSQGLSGSPANAQGFVDGLASAGWNINFNWGELAAWESDWNASDDQWVDAADFVFYTGHASGDGWVLNMPNDTSLHFSEVGAWPGSPNDLWGHIDAEWLIIAACGPLQSSHFVTNVGNAFDRWRGVFDGLHQLLGYAAVTFDNTTEGSRVTELTLSGWSVIDAWFRTAWEIQPSTNGFSAPDGDTVYVAVMYADKGANDTRNDHIWGTGTTSPDSREPGQIRWLLWSGT